MLHWQVDMATRNARHASHRAHQALAAVLLAWLPPAAPATAQQSSCIAHRQTQGLNDTRIQVTSSCPTTRLVNICARIAGRIGTNKQAESLRPGESRYFEFFTPQRERLSYRLRDCAPGSTTRLDLCMPECPAEESVVSRAAKVVPRPAKIAACPDPADFYPPASRRLAEQGRVAVLVQVGAAGRALGTRVTQSSGYPRLDAAAEEFFRACSFDPGVPPAGRTINEKQVAVSFVLTD